MESDTRDVRTNKQFKQYNKTRHNGCGRCVPMWLEGPAKKAKRYTENKYEAFMAAFGKALHAQDLPTTRIYAIE